MKKFFIKLVYKILINKIFNPFLSLNIKPVELEFKETDKCLVIAPHPDDESIGCGGIMKLNSDKFEVLCLTHGSNDDIRFSEFNSAMNYAGITKFSMLNFKDKHIMDFKDEFNNIQINSFDYIFIPYIFDQHKDHKAVSVLLSNLLKKCKYKQNLKIAFYEVWSTINMPQYYVDISSVIEEKTNMINFHKSQIETKDYAGKIIGLNSYRGLLRSLEAVEAFSIMEVKDFLNVVSTLTE